MYQMMQNMLGSYCGFGMLLALGIGILVLVALVLLVIWLIKQIRK